jgi:uncharacterized protein YqeY
MGLREQLTDDLKEAMRQQDDVRKRTIRSVLTAIQRAETELDNSGQRVNLSEDDIVVLIARQARQREESIVEYQHGGREDLVAEEQAELAILQTYLPQQLGQAEIEAQAREVIAEVGATGPRDMGRVMKPLLARLKGRADGTLVNQIVRKLLGG